MIKQNGRSVWKARNQIEFPAHCLHITAKRGKQQIATAFDTRDSVLTNSKTRSEVLLSMCDGYAQIFKRSQFPCALLHFGTAFGRQRSQHII